MRKLTWREGSITVTPNPTPVDELAQQLVAKLVKFEEVDFGTFGFLRDASNANAVLRGVAASSGEGSKLRVLSMPGHFPYLSESLAKAREKLTVKILMIEDLEVITIDDDEDVNQPDNEDDDDEVIIIDNI